MGAEITLDYALRHAIRGVMKHNDQITETDQRDLESAAAMVKGGRALRQRVLARVRARVWRKRKTHD